MNAFARIAYTAIIAAALYGFVNINAPTIEGKLFPVAVATEYDIEADGIDHISLSGVMEKYRECDFLTMKAYIYSIRTGQRVLAQVDVKETIKLRPEGSFPWGDWRLFTDYLKITAGDLGLEVITTHQCHPLWVTETTFLDTRVTNVIDEQRNK